MEPDLLRIGSARPVFALATHVLPRGTLRECDTPRTRAKTNVPCARAPAVYEEWWLGPASGDAAQTSGWRRPYRRTHAAPHDAFLMAPPVAHQDQLLWVGSTGRVYTLPMHRAREASTPPFPLATAACLGCSEGIS